MSLFALVYMPLAVLLLFALWFVAYLAYNYAWRGLFASCFLLLMAVFFVLPFVALLWVSPLEIYTQLPAVIRSAPVVLQEAPLGEQGWLQLLVGLPHELFNWLMVHSAPHQEVPVVVPLASPFVEVNASSRILCEYLVNRGETPVTPFVQSLFNTIEKNPYLAAAALLNRPHPGPFSPARPFVPFTPEELEQLQSLQHTFFVRCVEQARVAEWNEELQNIFLNFFNTHNITNAAQLHEQMRFAPHFMWSLQQPGIEHAAVIYETHLRPHAARPYFV